MHSKKWVHRDIKPENIIVNSMAEVRLIDFALACRPYGAFLTQFTGKRKAVGTRSYMSPEQIIGRSLDRRADIYSFGIMLYQIVAGRLPFIGSSGSDLLRKHIHSKPDPIDPKRDTRRSLKSYPGDVKQGTEESPEHGGRCCQSSTFNPALAR